MVSQSPILNELCSKNPVVAPTAVVMKTTIKNQNKNFSRHLLTFLLSAIFTLNISAKTNTNSDTFYSLDNEKQKLEQVKTGPIEYRISERWTTTNT